MGRIWPSNDGFLSKRYHFFREASGLCEHTKAVSLHFLVNLVFLRSY